MVPQHHLSHFMGWLCQRRWLPFKNWQIRYFIKRYNVDINLALQANLEDYPTFSSFFIRQLKDNARPLPQSPNAVASPADGCISQLGTINANQVLQAKGFNYSIETLLGSESWAKQFLNGYFATIYLAPKDYHRVHMPIAGKLIQTIFIPGKLFSVNPATVSAVANLFARNERLVCLFETAAGPLAVIFVGAMLVGSIYTSWNKQTIKSKKLILTDYMHNPINFEMGAELGYFNMGSTVILLFGENAVKFADHLQVDTNLLMGDEIGTLIIS